MTKKEVLRPVSSLIRDLDNWTTKRVKASLDKDEQAYRYAMFELEGLAVDSQQELTFLYDYIDENVKDKLTNEELEQEILRTSERYPEVSFAKLSRIAVHFYKLGKYGQKKEA